MSIWDNLFGNPKNDIDDLLSKGNPDELPEIEVNSQRNLGDDGKEQDFGRKSIITDPFFAQQSSQTLYRNKVTRLSNRTLKDVSLRDWLVSAIIQNRVDTLMRFSRPQITKFQPGFRIVKKDEHEEYTKDDHAEINNIQAFIYNCGRLDNTPAEDKMLFGELIKLVVRDALTFGHIGIEKIKTRGGALHRFRPVPAENLYLINKNMSKEQVEGYMTAVKNLRKPASNNDPLNSQHVNEHPIEYYKYIQVAFDQRPLAEFGDEDLIFKLFNPQNFADSNGYAYSPLEMAILNITNHMNTETYNCFPAKTARITLDNRSTKFIEDIKVGEKVISHDGTVNQVVRTFEHNINEELVNIKPIGMMSIKSTLEHPHLIIDKKDFRNWKDFDKTPKIDWKKAKDIKPHDIVAIPRIKVKEQDFYFDFSKYADIDNKDGTITIKNRVRKYGNTIVPKKLLIDEDMGWFLGLYAADGCVHSNHKVRIDLHINEQYIADRLTNIFDKYNIKTYTTIHSVSKNCLQFYIASKCIVKMVEELVPGTCLNKSINSILLTAPKVTKLNILLGHIYGDGTNSSGDINSSTKSYDLATSLSTLANSCGFLLKIKEYKGSSFCHTEDNIPSYRLLFPRNVWSENNILFIKNKLAPIGKNPFYHVSNDYFLVRVSKVKRELFNGTVFNIEVENTNSYTVNQIASHNCNFFTHGQAAKGVLHLKGTVTQSQLTAFRRQFYNLINGAQNAWRTPIVAGLDDVQWVPMAGGSKEMEYLQYNMHLMRGICSQFQIDPMELGLDLLVTGGKAMNQMGTESKIEFSRERGLYPILMFLEDLINRDIIPNIDPKFAEKYRFQFEGYSDETPQTEVALLQAEMTVNKTMNDLLTAARKPKIKHPVGDLPMNQAFWGVVNATMTKGEIREEFFGDKGASKKKELQYLSGDPSFIPWQTFLLQKEQAKQQQEAQAAQGQQEQQSAQAQQQQQQQEAQHAQQMAEGKHKREQEAHEAEMAQLKGQAAYNAQQHGKKV